MIFKVAVSYVLSFFIMIGAFFGWSDGADVADTEEIYSERLNSIEIYQNSIEDAVPMTMVHDLIQAHLTSPLPEGKTQKKVLVIGYDGCRADTIAMLAENKKSAVNEVLSMGGSAYMAYCGGVPYPIRNIQATSTAPGWCSMLTGVWCDEHGIFGNGQPKSNDYLTILTTDVENGLVEDSAFYVSWDGHFVDEDSTYSNELRYIEEKGLDVTFSDSATDAGTYAKMAKDLKQTECTDFIFGILEFCDHIGHHTGFGVWNKAYKTAFRYADGAGYHLIRLVKERDTYDTEDWLILLTSDHGGYETGHGGATLQERMMYIISNKPLPADA